MNMFSRTFLRTFEGSRYISYDDYVCDDLRCLHIVRTNDHNQALNNRSLDSVLKINAVQNHIESILFLSEMKQLV